MQSSTSSETEVALSAAIHLEYVRNMAQHGSEESIHAVASFHESLFMQKHGKDLERYVQQKKLSEDRLRDLEHRLSETRNRLIGENPHVTVEADGKVDTKPNAPWNLWDLSMFWSAGLAALSLILFGVLNISYNLLESGIITFQNHPLRAYLWAALLPVGALAVKVGWDFIQSSKRRHLYIWSCLIIGMVSILIWIATYAMIYPSLSMTTEEHIAGITLHDSADDQPSSMLPGGTKTVDMALVASQALAEIFLSAVLGIYMARLYASHRPVKLTVNPVFHSLDSERQQLEAHIAGERLALAEASGNSDRLRHQLKVFVAYAESLFQREVALRQDRGFQKLQLLDEISEQIKSRMDPHSQNHPSPSETSNPGAYKIDTQ
jgi:hypothetical protein